MSWRPIKTAPRIKHKLVDIWVSFIDHEGKINSKVDGRFPDCAWSGKYRAWLDRDNTRFRETVKKLPEKGYSKMIVTHWMPRPKGPKP